MKRLNFAIESLFLLSFCIALNSTPLPLPEGNSPFLEGDMRKEPKPRSLGLLSDSQKLWSNGVVPYTFNNSQFDETEKRTILDAMELMTEKTGGCITFVAKTNQENWIKIIKNSGCWSWLGRSYYSGAQEVSLDDGCVYKGTAVHEFMHALGFEHEQNRPDRDDYITIHFENVASSNRYNFEKAKDRQTFGTPYDLKSIMQYSEYAFSNNGEKTIVPKNGMTLKPSYDKTDQEILTDYDIESIKNLYQCNAHVTEDYATDKTEDNIETTLPITTLPAYSNFQITLDNDFGKVDIYYYNNQQWHILRRDVEINHEWTLTAYVTLRIKIIADNFEKELILGRGNFLQSGQKVKISEL